MSDALKRAEHYRDLAKRYLRLAASTENPNHYLRIAVQYNALAEAEELRTSHGDGDSAQRRSTVRKESDEVETGQRPKPIPVRGGRGQKSEMTIGTRRGEARMLRGHSGLRRTVRREMSYFNDEPRAEDAIHNIFSPSNLS